MIRFRRLFSTTRRIDVPPSGEDRLRIGDYRVEPSTGRVWNRQGTSRLEPRAIELLNYLAQRPGKVISVEQLRRDVWGSDHLVDEVVRRCISQIRKAFKDDPNDPAYIETVRKRGYRLLATAVGEGSDGPPLLSALRAYRAPLLASIGIVLLVFAFSTGGPVDDTEVERAVSLVDQVDWHTVARNQYSEYDREGIESAIALYQELIESEAGDSKALAGLADALMQRYLRWDTDEEVANQARTAAIRSIRIDPRSPDAFKSLGAYYHFRGRHDSAIEFYRAAIQRNDSYWTAWNNGGETLRDAGAYEHAKQWFECALESTDDRAGVMSRIADVDLRSGNADSAATALKFVVKMSPGNREAGLALARTELILGNHAAAVETCKQLEETVGRVPECGVLRGITNWTRGEFDAAKEELRALQRSRPRTLAGYEATIRLAAMNGVRQPHPVSVLMNDLGGMIDLGSVPGESASDDIRFLQALWFAATGQTERLLDPLAATLATGTTTYAWIGFDPIFGALRADSALRERLADEVRAALATRPHGIRAGEIERYRLEGCQLQDTSSASLVEIATRLDPNA